MAFGVTAFQNVTNVRGNRILFEDSENSGCNRYIDPMTNVGVSNCWIPWCHNDQEFPALPRIR